jgi:short-subunit dehydrogenase
MRAIISGASTGIGAAMAHELSRRGWELALVARRGDLLDQLVGELKTPAVALPCDVTDSAAVHEAVAKSGPFDLAIANAGVGLPTHAAKFPLADAELMVRVNFLGMLYLFDAVIPSMIERKGGRFVGVASIAGLRGIPTTSIYSATKSAMQSFLEASRIELKPYGVGVTIVNPGFIATPMTAKNKFKMPFLMEADEAARVIVNGIERGKRVVEFPRPMSLLMRFTRLVPDAWYERATQSSAQRRQHDLSKVKR